MIIVTVKFQITSNKTYDYLFYNNSKFTINKEHPARLVVGCSATNPHYNLIYLISCKKVIERPEHVTSFLRLIGDNLFESGHINLNTLQNKNTRILPQSPPILSISLCQKRKTSKYELLIKKVDDEIEFLEICLDPCNIHLYWYKQDILQSQLEDAKRRKEYYESKI